MRFVAVTFSVIFKVLHFYFCVVSVRRFHVLQFQLTDKRQLDLYVIYCGYLALGPPNLHFDVL